MYIPKQRTLRLVEIQESVLPEEEYIIGISDLGYFQGVGFSMPIPFDRNYFQTGTSNLMSKVSDELHIEFSNHRDSIVLEPQGHGNIEEHQSVPNPRSEDSGILWGCDNIEASPQPLASGGDDRILESMEVHTESPDLHAFLPGRFYCSRHKRSVDGVLIEVDQQEVLGMTLSSFRPEDVHSFDVEMGLIVDRDGEPQKVKMNLDTLGKFRASLLREVERETDVVIGAASLREIDYSYETDLAVTLSDKIQLEDLKRAYVSGSNVAGRMMNLYDDIEKNGLLPVFRIYLRNRKHPKGTIVDLSYRSLEGILDLTDLKGIECPREIDLGLELRWLSFSKLSGAGAEVDIEQAILEAYILMESEIGIRPSLEQIIELLFSQEADH